MSETTFKRQKITHQQVVQVLQEFDAAYPTSNAFDSWLERSNYRYALSYEGNLYPPKHILSEVTGLSIHDFSGGEETNRVFRQLGMVIIDKPKKVVEDNLSSEEDRDLIAQTMELTLREGGKVLVASYQYERDSQARKVCIDHYGLDCVVTIVKV